MQALDRLLAADAIRNAKARYFRGVDSGDGALVRSVLAENCVLDYRGCCTDRATGIDHLPAMNVVLNGRAAFRSGGLAKAGIVSVHQGHGADIKVASADEAEAVWSMTDRLFMPPGAPFRLLTGYGYYHETYVCDGEAWLIRTLRIERIRIEVA